MEKEMLDVLPIRAMEYEEKNGLITVLFINPSPNYFERLLFKKRLNIPKKIDLDDVGSFVWNRCDGETEISEIIKLVQNEFGEKVEQAEERVIMFIKQLSSGRLINLFKKSYSDSIFDK